MDKYEEEIPQQEHDAFLLKPNLEKTLRLVFLKNNILVTLTKLKVPPLPGKHLFLVSF